MKSVIEIKEDSDQTVHAYDINYVPIFVLFKSKKYVSEQQVSINFEKYYP